MATPFFVKTAKRGRRTVVFEKEANGAASTSLAAANIRLIFSVRNNRCGRRFALVKKKIVEYSALTVAVNLYGQGSTSADPAVRGVFKPVNFSEDVLYFRVLLRE